MKAMNTQPNTEPEILDPLIDGEDPAAPRVPTLDDLMADDLKPDDLVVIDGKLHKFVHKGPGPGPHVFLSTDDQVTVKIFTSELIARIRPRGNAPVAEDTSDPMIYLTESLS